MLKGVFTSVMLNETQSVEKTLWRTTTDDWKWASWALKRVRMLLGFFSLSFVVWNCSLYNTKRRAHLSVSAHVKLISLLISTSLCEEQQQSMPLDNFTGRNFRLCGLWAHTESQRWRMWTWLTHYNSVIVGSCFNPTFWLKQVCRVRDTEAHRRSRRSANVSATFVCHDGANGVHEPVGRNGLTGGLLASTNQGLNCFKLISMSG